MTKKISVWAAKTLYPDDYGRPRTLYAFGEYDALEPFIRRLQSDDQEWWRKEAVRVRQMFLTEFKAGLLGRRARNNGYYWEGLAIVGKQYVPRSLRF